MFSWFEKSLLFTIVILAILCLIMSTKNAHSEIYDTIIDLRQPDTTINAVDSLDTLNKRIQNEHMSERKNLHR